MRMPTIPDAPCIAGLMFRSITGVEDASALRAVHLGRAAHDQVDPLSTTERIPTCEQISAALAAATAAGEQDRWLVAQVANEVVGYCRIGSWQEEDGTWVYLSLGWVLPAWRGRGLGTAMVHWAETLSHRLAVTEHPGARAELAANASSTEHDATALLQHEGYAAGYAVLEMELDASTPVTTHPMTGGIEVRPVEDAHLPAIAASVLESYRQEYEGGRFNESIDLAAYLAELSEGRHDPTLWQVAWDATEVVGQVLPAIQSGRAELFEVSVRPAWRRRGISRALLTRAILALRDRGIEIIRLHTVADFRTRARDLYASVGFRVLKEFPRYRKPFSAHIDDSTSVRAEAQYDA